MFNVHIQSSLVILFCPYNLSAYFQLSLGVIVFPRSFTFFYKFQGRKHIVSAKLFPVPRHFYEHYRFPDTRVGWERVCRKQQEKDHLFVMAGEHARCNLLLAWVSCGRVFVGWENTIFGPHPDLCRSGSGSSKVWHYFRIILTPHLFTLMMP
jgi:hypothetical protein